MGWSVEKAIGEFEYLSARAFSKSDKTGIPVFRHSAQLLYSHRYKGQAIDMALQEVFGQGLLFGANETSHSEKVKVGVLAAVHGSRRPYLFTNYSRNSTRQNTDYLVREDDLEDEMKCWEAARSTSAAPTYFPPHYHRAKRQSYVDGALQRNNPIQILEEERRAIWKDESPPDIMLSIGTGIQIESDGTASKRHKTARRLLPMGIRGRIAVGLDVIQNTLDCNRQWNEFVISTKWNQSNHRICHRLDIGLEERPRKIDDVAAIVALKAQARRYLRQRSGPYLDRHYKCAQRHISVVARRLIAALFYFETSANNKDDRCVGIIHCRLSSAMRANFRHLLSESPAFRVRQRDETGLVNSPLKPQFDELTFSGQVSFQVKSNRRVIEMILPRWSSWERISGFSGYPRW